MTDAKCPWCGAERDVVDRWQYRCETPVKVLERSHELARGYECLRTELAQHKQRLIDQSARLAAAESELRRLRQVIDSSEVWHVAPTASGDKWAWLRKPVDGFVTYVPCKLIPLSELEATNANQ